MRSKIIVFDDDPLCLDSYQRILSSIDREVACYQDPDEALKAFELDPYGYSLAFIDHQYRVDGVLKKVGVEIATKFKALNPMLKTCIVSGDNSEESLRTWLSAKVDNYIYKPLRKTETLAFSEYHTNDYERNYSPAIYSPRPAEKELILKKFNLVGESPELLDCVKKALKFVNSDLNVLLLGETGTGKELFAQGIHQCGPSSKLNIFPVNCSSYIEESQLLEVELFGSEKGAFTGAEKKTGIFELAQGGTVFLDEIHHLSGPAQSKLLRVLQEKKIRRVGGQREIAVKFRIIAAAKPDLMKRCEEGTFLPDLYYRLKGLDLVIPPLRDRKRDIHCLAQFFLNELNRSGENPKQISTRTLEYLERYDWPGNVRELQQLIQNLGVLATEDIISPKYLPEEIKNGSFIKGDLKTLPDLDDEYLQKQTSLILSTLESVGNNFTEATRRLGLGEKRSTLRSRMKKLKIKDLSLIEKKGLLHQLATNFI